jgi:hypothetical protein
VGAGSLVVSIVNLPVEPRSFGAVISPAFPQAGRGAFPVHARLTIQERLPRERPTLAIVIVQPVLRLLPPGVANRENPPASFGARAPERRGKCKIEQILLARESDCRLTRVEKGVSRVAGQHWCHSGEPLRPNPLREPKALIHDLALACVVGVSRRRDRRQHYPK